MGQDPRDGIDLDATPEPSRDDEATTSEAAAAAPDQAQPEAHEAAPPAAEKKGKKGRRQRPHPFADEPSTEEEKRTDPRVVTLVWFLGSTLMAAGGWWLAQQYGYINNQITAHVDWELWNGTVLAVSLVFLAIGLWAPLKPRGQDTFRMAGWILFAAFWALTARDLFIRENSDYVNATAAIIFLVFGANYFAYHEWLNAVRGVRTFATRFLGVVAVITAGTYYVIAKIAPVRIGLIEMVGHHTNWSLNQFGFGSKLGLEFFIDKLDPWGPVLFFYPDKYCDDRRSDPIGEWCRDNQDEWTPNHSGGHELYTEGGPAENWFDELLLFDPASGTDPEALQIIPVSIILACTAIQSIMLFVGLFMGTRAPLKQKLVWSLGTGALIYFLNLLRNTLVIWAYGRGHASFFVIHNVVAKVLTLAALVGIALLAFKRMPAFLEALGSVLDMIHRDGPIERTLGIGRRRPEAPVEALAD